ncbi:MAG: putative LPS assembly protein LptD, partial [Bacteroidales bacterium]
DMQMGYKHTIPLSHNIRVFKNAKSKILQPLNSFALTPSLNYNGMFYTKQTYKWVDSWSESTDGDGNTVYNPIVEDTIVQQFSYAHSLFPSLSAGLAPQIYGSYTFRPGSRMEAIRHVMTPSVSASYVPDMSEFQANYYRYVYDERNNDTAAVYSIYENEIYGTPTTRGASGSINFSLKNTLEAKVRSKNDTVDEVEKVKLLDNLNFSTSYNIFHDDTLSPAWQPINFNGATKLFNKKLNLSFRGVMDPFGYDDTRRRTRETYFSQTGKLVRFTSLSASAGFSLSSQKAKDKAGGAPGDAESPLGDSPLASTDDLGSSYDPTMDDYYGSYVDFEIPWTMRIDYSFSYTKPQEKATVVQTIRASGDFSLSPKWKIGYSTGYDLDRKKITTTNLSIYRDLHCWEMRLSVVPFGTYQSYNFQINAKSAILSDLKYKKNKSWQDEF